MLGYGEPGWRTDPEEKKSGMIFSNHSPSLVLCAFAQMLAHTVRGKKMGTAFFQLVWFFFPQL